MLSDSDSDFYGDDQADIAQLEARQAAYDPAQYWSNRAQLSMEVPSLFSSSSAGAATTSSSSTAARKLHNPYEGLTTCAKQLSESPQAFLSRLPPSTTDCDPVSLPWIYVANPFIPRCQVHHDNQQREEPEAPAEAGMQLGAFMEGGRERLELLGDFVSKVEPGSSLLRQGGFGKAPAGPKGAVMNREMKQARDSAVSDLLMLARMLKVRTGKWMLFVPPFQVDIVWSTVVHATLKNELGIAAKVAPRPEKGSTRDRLICVYTYDFGDKDDVARVLVRLKELDLVKCAGPAAKPIYYKADAYTYLGIDSNNPWGLRASLYNSKDMFEEINAAQGKPTPPTAPKKMRHQRQREQDNDAMDWTF